MPTGDFNQLIKNIDDALKHLYKLKVELLIAPLLTTYNLSHTVNFSTGIKIPEVLPLIIYLWITVE